MPQDLDSWNFNLKRGHVNLVLELYCTLDQRRIQPQIRGGAEGGRDYIRGGRDYVRGGRSYLRGGSCPPWPPLGSATALDMKYDSVTSLNLAVHNFFLHCKLFIINMV